jgi:ABC-type amino acid transport substrate-binding protein
MTPHSSKSLSFLGLAVLLASVAGAGDLADVKSRGKLVMLTFPAVDDPFVAVDVEAMRTSGLKLTEMKDPAAFRGVDVDLIKGFAQSLGVKLEMHPLTGGYGELLPALVAKQGDLAASRLTITPKRKESADFSAPYFVQWAVAAVPKNSKLASMADLKGKRVAVMKGSSQLEFLNLLNLNPEIRLTAYNMESYNAALEGQADYALMDSRANVGEPVSAQFSDLKVGVRVHAVEQAVMLRKGSDLKPALDAYIDGLRQSGELVKLLTTHGQGAAPKAPAPKP